MKEKVGLKKDSIALVKTFLTTILVAFLVTNSQNFIFTILDNWGFKNEIFQKAVLSAIIALAIGLLRTIGVFLFTVIIESLEPLKIELCILKNGNPTIETITFTPKGSEYLEQEFEIEVKFKPKGRVQLLIMQYFGIVIDIYFNPEVIDILFDSWKGQASSFEVSNRTIRIDLLKQISIKGREFYKREHKLKENFIIKPIRVHNMETYLDYNFSSRKYGVLSKVFTKKITLDYDSVNLVCQGEK
ncbi:hypothetical protein QJV38_11920 [Listeria cossartiae subsp. cayugensis]|uniref:Uncharacterized protein n=1 Tax=Listeria cossartiae subsp. cayugensis TaxID=2713505 RepID=A0ABU2IPK3_9LIST|nr:hypothetical protein [Listeria cossartiae]MDT0050111.1 hypothetical protein [Listeria cossartiae subsp. cayugensis]MDT0066843.1 hypothetical protein [Listeria cossartiae subsp. cayugensis]MDT0080502.1 hypothetical protein [Listeria cossartiae subsp. cayugensis]MDT0083062.1 hypothetical protein [Listeria cossartiae subsp. cayugensis]MDT0088846.1 hypothetical protein [Listeria cossartiae subsp. cayugensis]